MSSPIRIKRRASGSPGAPATLENAELAFNEVDGVLYYGKGTGGVGGTATTIEAIGGNAKADASLIGAASGLAELGSDSILKSTQRPTTDGILEGITNKYFSVSAARSAAVVNSTSGSQTDQAASVAAMKSYVATEIGSVSVPVTSVNSQTGAVVLNADDILEKVSSPVNLYFTATRAKGAVVLNTLAGSETDQAPSVSAVNSALSGKEVSSNKSSSTSLGTSNTLYPTQGAVKSYVDTQIGNVVGGMSYKGVLDASGGSYPATPAKGDYYVVTVAGTISAVDYQIGDWAAYNGTTWNKIDNTDAISSVNGFSGAVVLTTDNISEPGSPTNLWFTASRAKSAAVVNSTAGSETDQAPSVSAMKSYVSGASSNVAAGTGISITGSGTKTIAIDTAVVAQLASPTFTGTVTIPTVAGSSDSSTKAASTAFVQACITALGLGSMSTQSASAVAITGGTIDGVTIDGGTF
jgi:hypothetical protein